jgi:hypothetical protein
MSNVGRLVERLLGAHSGGTEDRGARSLRDPWRLSLDSPNDGFDPRADLPLEPADLIARVRFAAGLVQIRPCLEKVRPGRGRIQSALGDRQLSSGLRQSALGRIELALGQIELALGRIELSPGRIELALGQIELSPGRIELSLGRIELCLGRIELCQGWIELRLGRIELCQGRIELRQGRIELSPGQIELALRHRRSVPVAEVVLSQEISPGFGAIRRREAPILHDWPEHKQAMVDLAKRWALAGV